MAIILLMSLSVSGCPTATGDTGKYLSLPPFLLCICVLLCMIDYLVSQRTSLWLSGKECACIAGDSSLTLGLGRCPGGGHGNPL